MGEDQDRESKADARRVDAVMVPLAMSGGGGWGDKTRRIRAIVAPILGLAPGEPINIPWPPAGDYFVRRYRGNPGDADTHAAILATHADTIGYPQDHERAGQPRYDWEAREDGVKLGRLRPEPE